MKNHKSRKSFSGVELLEMLYQITYGKKRLVTALKVGFTVQ
ncbi:hypothetical protein [Bartonella alsatica]